MANAKAKIHSGKFEVQVGVYEASYRKNRCSFTKGKDLI